MPIKRAKGQSIHQHMAQLILRNTAKRGIFGVCHSRCWHSRTTGLFYMADTFAKHAIHFVVRALSKTYAMTIYLIRWLTRTKQPNKFIDIHTF